MQLWVTIDGRRRETVVAWSEAGRRRRVPMKRRYIGHPRGEGKRTRWKRRRKRERRKRRRGR